MILFLLFNFLNSSQFFSLSGKCLWFRVKWELRCKNVTLFLPNPFLQNVPAVASVWRLCDQTQCREALLHPSTALHDHRHTQGPGMCVCVCSCILMEEWLRIVYESDDMFSLPPSLLSHLCDPLNSVSSFIPSLRWSTLTPTQTWLARASATTTSGTCWAVYSSTIFWRGSLDGMQQRTGWMCSRAGRNSGLRLVRSLLQ